MAKSTKGPKFLRYVRPVVETLREMGSSGSTDEIIDRVIERMGISEAEQAETTSNGQSRVRNQINWARFYLAKAGIVDAPRRGVWSLTDAGRAMKLDHDPRRLLPRRRARPRDHRGGVRGAAGDRGVPVRAGRQRQHGGGEGDGGGRRVTARRGLKRRDAPGAGGGSPGAATVGRRQRAAGDG